MAEDTKNTIVRCDWVSTEQIEVDYHDTEWGVPVRDSRALWEMLVLEGFQAGLSWITILKKRENFREAFCQFDPEVIASWGDVEIERLLTNDGIVRHRGKIAATIGNARAYLQIEDFSQWCWNYVEGEPLISSWDRTQDIPTSTPLSTRISKDLKTKGFRFCGPTIVYAWMQAVGIVNDHLNTCDLRD
ncbi:MULTISPECIES: DNA-3-methyladenine glycosylase I [Tritonibacter]|jgi:DNA-3-methyladenine glycosylase I|uniref:DNA-3-methyladenine glycosylase I n=2 Tax=Tritonibacter TaxID=2083206 RepID=A0A843YPK0_9RHOB|nr:MULTISPECIES: DNA-3-methyladenine glycosylase I [Tritonibacter]KUP91584.1 DNA-3-methyladenine glycosylase 1 [Tritonibacter horizontis]MQQ10527.1 DNA-3-methyladenine glycosylase I [Tritonibacter litoralis]